MKLRALILAFGIASVIAHGDDDLDLGPEELAARNSEIVYRSRLAQNCAREISDFHNARKMAKRGLFKRQTQATETASAIVPHESTIKNVTCITAPEIEEGPFFLNNELLRQDLREDQPGILLALDVGVIDIATCAPLPKALVEIWSANATGFYSGFTASGGIPGSPKSDSTNFLRGAWETNENGIVEFNTIYPGFYSGRAIHVHTIIQTDVTYNANGTVSSKTGAVLHTGQVFFEETLNDQVLALPAYLGNTNKRMYNTADRLVQGLNGYNGFVDTELLGASLSDGVLGFLTIGVDTTARKRIDSGNYYTGRSLKGARKADEKAIEL